MGLVKRTYVDGETVITAGNLNDIQDEIIQNATNIGDGQLVGFTATDLTGAANELKNTLNHKADVIYDTASGDIASFPDGADGLPVKDLTVAIEPVQSGSGDPSPTNVRPISGWTGANVTRTGKNLLPNGTTNSTSRGVTFTRNANGSVSAVGTNDNTGASTFSLINQMLLPAGNYILSGGVTNISVIVRNGDVSGTQIVSDTGSGATFTLESDSNVGVLIRIQSGTSNVNATLYPMIRLSTVSDATFEPYSGTTIPISWQSSAGTVYAASLDALAGSLKVRPYYASYNGETLVGPWISSMDAYTPGGTPTTGAQVVDLGGVETEYTIDPVTISTLLGQNNIFADCGPSTVEYPCDTKLYIQKINTPTDDDMIADANIASGKYFIVNNNLYLSTAAILAGDPIKPGTNCTLTNLAAALNALNS